MKKFILYIITLFSAGFLGAQHEYKIKVEPNYSPKKHLTDITNSINHTVKTIEEDYFHIQSSEIYTQEHFNEIIDGLGLSLVYFEKLDTNVKPTSTSIQTKACCEIELIMLDSYGDGWNGGYLTVTIDGISTNYSATGGGTLEYLSYCDAENVSIDYTAGSYENENSFTFDFPDGSTFSDGPTPATGTVFSGSFQCGSPTPQDCEGAEMVCSNNSLQGNSNGDGNFYDLKSTNDGCLSGENQSSWYYVFIEAGGTLSMDIVPDNGTDDYDFAIWGPYDETTASSNCPPTENPIRCNWVLHPKSASCGTNTNPTGLAIDATLPTSNDDCNNNPYIRHLDTQADEVYILVIDNYTGSSEPFDLNWGGTATLGCKSISLPVELLNFEVINKGIYNNIFWSTSSEKNNDYFILEYSANSSDWSQIATVKGAGSTSDEQHYNFIHRDFEEGINYYRLTQVDYDGKKEPFNIISIENTSNKELIKRINIMGQEVGENYSGVVILYYSDGSTVKTVQN